MELPGSYNRVKWYGRGRRNAIVTGKAALVLGFMKGRQPTWNTDICGRRKTVTAVGCAFSGNYG